MKPTFTTKYDPITKRHRCECATCAYTAVRAKREASEHVMAQHIAYQHGAPA